MTDAQTSLREDLEAVRTAAHDLWLRTRTAETAAWELYRGTNLAHQDAWQASNEVKKRAEVAYDQLNKACKAAANMAAGGSGTEQAP